MIDAPINRLPAGFLGFVDVKAMGRNPSKLPDMVQPMIDMRPYYQAGGRRNLTSGTLPLNAPGAAISNLVVPQNKIWLIENLMTSASTLTAGQALQYTPAIYSPIGTSASLAQGELSPAFSPGDIPHARFGDQANFYVALPGYQMGVIATRVTAGPITIAVTAVYIEVDF